MNKTLLLLLSILCFVLFNTTASAQAIKKYEIQWKKVDELIQKKNLPKSALEEVKKIYALAKKEKQDAQIIKAVVYMVGLQRETREDNESLAIDEIEKEITTAKEPVVSIFRSLLAGV